MIIAVVASDARETRGAELKSAEPLLMQSVRRRLKNNMIHAAALHLGEFPRKRDRIGRGERRVGRVKFRRVAERPDVSDGRAERVGEQVLRERRDRGLAVGSGDGEFVRRMRRMETRGERGEMFPGIVVRNENGVADMISGVGSGDDGDGAASDSLADVFGVCVICLQVRKRGEDESRLDIPGVSGESCDVGVVGVHGVGEEFAESHCVSGSAEDELNERGDVRGRFIGGGDDGFINGLDA